MVSKIIRTLLRGFGKSTNFGWKYLDIKLKYQNSVSTEL